MINLNAQITVGDGLIQIMRELSGETIPEAKSPEIMAIVSYLAHTLEYIRNQEKILTDADRLLSLEGQGTKQKVHDQIKQHLKEHTPFLWYKRDFGTESWIIRAHGFALIIERSTINGLKRLYRSYYESYVELGAFFKVFKKYLDQATSSEDFANTVYRS